MTPVRKKTADGQSEPPPEMYVVCLDCGKQFAYDWENMRVGKAVDISQGPPAGDPETPKIPFRTKSKMRYLLWGAALSSVWVLGKAVKSRKARTGGEHHGESDDIKSPKSQSSP
jgi:hypothetical protein